MAIVIDSNMLLSTKNYYDDCYCCNYVVNWLFDSTLSTLNNFQVEVAPGEDAVWCTRIHAKPSLRDTPTCLTHCLKSGLPYLIPIQWFVDSLIRTHSFTTYTVMVWAWNIPQKLMCWMLGHPDGSAVLRGFGNCRRWGLPVGSRSLRCVPGAIYCPGLFLYSSSPWFLSAMKWTALILHTLSTVMTEPSETVSQNKYFFLSSCFWQVFGESHDKTD
jgi:hypothetical protein